MNRRRFQVGTILMAITAAISVWGSAETEDSRLEEIDALMSGYASAGTFSGAILVAEGGDVIYERGFGMANRDWEIPNALDTRFRIASVSKVFTQVLARQLIDEGLLSLHGVISDYLPDYAGPGADEITVRHLLDHKSGIVGESAVEDLERVERTPFTHDRMLDMIAQYELAAPPGRSHVYSNFGYYILGVLIETVSGRTYAELLEERVCAPAGMTDTFPEVTTAVVDRRATGYWMDAEGIVTVDTPLDMSFVFGGGQLLSTASDLYRFVEALRAGEFLDRMSSQAVYDWEVERRPIGDGRQKVTAFESGPASINGFRASMHSYPREERVVIVLENMRGPGAVPVFDVGRNIAAVLYGAPYEP